MKKMQQCHPTLKAAPVIINIDDARRELFIKLTKAALVQHRAATQQDGIHVRLDMPTPGNWGERIQQLETTMNEANMSSRERELDPHILL
jgi:hypothetical protein